MDESVNLNNDHRDYIAEIQEWIRNHALLVTTLIFLTTKIIVLTFYITLFTQLGFTVGNQYPPFHTGDTLVDLLGTRWDSSFYLIVAENGQYFDPERPDDTRVWNFAPLYPLFIRILMDFGKLFQIEIPVATAAVLVANFFSLTSTIAFFYLSRLYVNEEKAIGATLLFSFFPTVFVFSTVAYAEPVFLTFAILSWYFFEKKNYKFSGFTLALATLARFPGALIFFLYIPIYLGRKIKEKGWRNSLGCLLAIPLFPLLVVIRGFQQITFKLALSDKTASLINDLQQKLNLNEEKREKISQWIYFLDIGLSWVLIFGILPLGWIFFANITAPAPLSEITYSNWGAKFVYPFAGFWEMLDTGDIKWTLEKYLFVFFAIGMGLIVLKKRPSFSLLIIGQTLFYTGYTGIHAWGAPRYTGTIFLGPLVLAEELASNKMIAVVLSLFITYGFIALWQFCNWSIWLI